MNSSKDKILRALREKSWVSGQELADIAGISRTAVWKHIKSFQKQGYHIKSVTGRGYLLEAATDDLLPQEIRAGLQTRILGSRIEHFQELDSTQEMARKRAHEGVIEGYTVLAEKQSQGRGRLNRKWESLPGSLALSVVLRPRIPLFKAFQIPILSGVALARSIRETTGIKAGLKWPNDILINRKKAGGILSEVSAETERVDYVSIGIGLNINCPIESIPAEIRGRTTSLSAAAGLNISRVKLVQRFLKDLENLYLMYLHEGFPPIRTGWKELDTTLGNTVEVQFSDRLEEGKAEDIDEHGALIIRTQSGATIAVRAGDVTIKSVTGN